MSQNLKGKRLIESKRPRLKDKIKMDLKTCGGSVWTAYVWSRIGTSDVEGLWKSGFGKRREKFWEAEQLPASQKGHYSVELCSFPIVSYMPFFSLFFLFLLFFILLLIFSSCFWSYFLLHLLSSVFFSFLLYYFPVKSAYEDQSPVAAKHFAVWMWEG